MLNKILEIINGRMARYSKFRNVESILDSFKVNKITIAQLDWVHNIANGKTGSMDEILGMISSLARTSLEKRDELIRETEDEVKKKGVQDIKDILPIMASIRLGV